METLHNNQMQIVQPRAMQGAAISDPRQTCCVCTTTRLNEPKHTKPQFGRTQCNSYSILSEIIQNKNLHSALQNEDSPFEWDYFHRFCRISVSTVLCYILGVGRLRYSMYSYSVAWQEYPQTISSIFFITTMRYKV